MSKKRRGRHEGTVRQRRDGRWEARREVGIGENGKRIQIVKYGKTKTEALARVAAEGLAPRRNTTGNLSLAEYLAIWLERVRLSNRPATFKLRESTIRNHVNPVIGGCRLRDVRPENVIRLLQYHSRANTGKATQLAIFAVLSTALNDACREGLIVENPIAKCPKPKVERGEMHVWTAEQALTFLATTKTSPYHALFVLALATGMREGELFALKWDDVDFGRNSIFIQHTLTETLDGKLALTPPKTKSSRRRVIIPPFAAEVLKQHRDARILDGTYSDVVFTVRSRSGGRAFLRKSNFLRREYQPLLKQSGVPVLPFHGLRHVANSLLLDSGVSVNVVAERMGHSSTRTTLDLYGHVLPNGQDEAAAKVQRIFEKSTGGTPVVKPPSGPLPIRMKKTRAPYRGAGPYVVEVSGLEPLTPYMRSKCSTS